MAGFTDRAPDPVDLHVVPFPAVTIVFDLGGGLRVDHAGGVRRGSVVAGLAPGNVRGSGRQVQCLQVRLSPVVAHAVFGASTDLQGGVIALDELWPDDAARTEEQLRGAASWDARFAIVEAALGRVSDAGRTVDPEVAFAWEQMARAQGRIRVDLLAVEVGWTRKRLWSRFRSQVGITPKVAARLVRFDHAVHRLAAGDNPARVAAEGGYVDQSHLHRDVMTFAGVTPRAAAVAPWLSVDDVAWPTAGA
jgi:AraC-like DNA-binding protein